MPKRRSRLSRRKPRFEPRPRLLIVCEGEKTEPTYLRDLSREEEVRLVEIVIVPGGGVPKTVVQTAVEMKNEAMREAKRARDSHLAFDEVWCVFDVDEHPKLAEAQDQANANGIQLAVSNPCFELWLLLHFQDQRAHAHRHDVQRTLRQHISDYRKEAKYSDLRDRYDDAIVRAAALEKWQHEQDRVGGNPSTGVHRLTERLRELGRTKLLDLHRRRS